MRKNRISLFAYFLALIFFISLIGPQNKAVAGANTLTINLPKDQDLLDFLAANPSQELTYWDISKDYSQEDLKNLSKIQEDLHSLSQEDLLSRFTSYKISGSYQGGSLVLTGINDGTYYFRNTFTTDKAIYRSEFVVQVSSISGSLVLNDKLIRKPLENATIKLLKVDQDGKILKGVGFELYSKEGVRIPLIGNYVYSPSGSSKEILFTDDKGEITVTGLPYGDYYFKEVQPLDGYKVRKAIEEFTLTDDQVKTIQVVNDRSRLGDHRFLKIDSSLDKLPLEGAVFKVTRLVNGQYQTLEVDGRPMILKSDQKGEFEVTNLPYGEYFLWEVKAPQGYEKLTKGVEFIIDSQSQEKILIIKNRKEQSIVVPKTGDVLIPLMIALGLGIFGLGYKLSKDDQ